MRGRWRRQVAEAAAGSAARLLSSSTGGANVAGGQLELAAALAAAHRPRSLYARRSPSFCWPRKPIPGPAHSSALPSTRKIVPAGVDAEPVVITTTRRPYASCARFPTQPIVHVTATAQCGRNSQVTKEAKRQTNRVGTEQSWLLEDRSDGTASYDAHHCRQVSDAGFAAAAPLSRPIRDPADDQPEACRADVCHQASLDFG